MHERPAILWWQTEGTLQLRAGRARLILRRETVDDLLSLEVR